MSISSTTFLCLCVTSTILWSVYYELLKLLLPKPKAILKLEK